MTDFSKASPKMAEALNRMLKKVPKIIAKNEAMPVVYDKGDGVIFDANDDSIWIDKNEKQEKPVEKSEKLDSVLNEINGIVKGGPGSGRHAGGGYQAGRVRTFSNTQMQSHYNTLRTAGHDDLSARRMTRNAFPRARESQKKDESKKG